MYQLGYPNPDAKIYRVSISHLICVCQTEAETKIKTCMDIKTHHVTPFFVYFVIAAAETWRKISIYVCIPALIAASANAYNLYARHQAHLEHERHEGHEAVKYPYMRLRAKVCKTKRRNTDAGGQRSVRGYSSMYLFFILDTI